MKRTVLFALLLLSVFGLQAQSYYWVMLTDKGQSTFDPYSYFDSQAIARYQSCGADLYDLSNYPLDADYTTQVNAIANEEIGLSRWLNAMAVDATPDQIARIEALPFVKAVLPIRNEAQLAQYKGDTENAAEEAKNNKLSNQLKRMQGDLFVQRGLDGTGIRIAVFDGGFPHVDKHPAFQHLRDGNRIVDTWNFPNKKADVYGWNSHGLMTLSCIAGIFNGKQLGLATGAEFLLYRTEVNLEPAKEEVWWTMAVERADQHGANIISSSLGYGKERYYTKDMDGTSLVARSANMAARKGILVCNSAGNEADEGQWKTIITPADADSVLCIGGIEASLSHYKHIYFSSYGPSADGRLKPNVSAFGHALAAAHVIKDTVMYVDGTSFSCPLVAGFAACAWQSARNLSAMQMKEAIERSGDLYPYFDYALGYGVPQASFFIGKTAKKEPTFTFEENQDSVIVVISTANENTEVFYNKQRPDGMLEQYANVVVSSETPVRVRFHKASIDSCTLNVWYDGYTNSYVLTTADQVRWSDVDKPFRADVESENGESTYKFNLNRTFADNIPSPNGVGGRYHVEIYFDFGSMVNTDPDELTLHGFSSTVHIGYRQVWALGKHYGLGYALEFGRQSYSLDKESNNVMDIKLGLDADHHVKTKELYHNDWSLELFQRICFVRGGIRSRGIYWDLGIYGSYSDFHYRLKTMKYNGVPGMDVNFSNPSFDGRYYWNWGLTTRIAYDMIGIYGRYRMTTYNIADDAVCPMRLPRLEVGIELNF